MATLSVITGSYEKWGETKKKYQSVGRVVKTDKWQSIKLDDYLTNFLKTLFWQDFEGWINIYDDKKESNSNNDDNPF